VIVLDSSAAVAVLLKEPGKHFAGTDVEAALGT